MSFIQRELDRIGDALRAEPDAGDREQLYAAQQALAWALEPGGLSSPMQMLRGAPREAWIAPVKEGLPDVA